jgi:hypothetical protein
MALASDRAFLERAYREILGREIDQDGFDYFAKALRAGEPRWAVIQGLARSDELARRLAPSAAVRSIRGLRPGRYRRDEDVRDGSPVDVFEAGGDEDLDWLESRILEDGYYERPGVWNLGVDTDKRVAAEMLASFAPERGLEIGCASGAVLECLRELGFRAEGVEISRLALARALPGVRDRIHAGDLLDLRLAPGYDLVFGLDVFEHLGPRRLDATLERVASLLAGGGHVFANVPAIGDDLVFGTVFPAHLRAWTAEGGPGRRFLTLPVDEHGYPLHGHLVWADSPWWVARFEAHGLRREVGIERALHRKYDAYLDRRSLPRKAFYVFSNDGGEDRRRAILDRVGREASTVLAGREV